MMGGGCHVYEIQEFYLLRLLCSTRSEILVSAPQEKQQQQQQTGDTRHTRQAFNQQVGIKRVKKYTYQP